MSEGENLTLEDLSMESFAPADLDPTSITFHDLFEDHVALYRSENTNTKEDTSENFLFDLNVDGADIENWDLDLIDSFQFGDFNLTDFETNKTNTVTVGNEELFVMTDCLADEIESPPDSKKKSFNIRRQSTRIQNQTRKKIAEQIQRENVRLAQEAQLLSNKDPPIKQNVNDIIINGHPPSPATQRYMAMPTDLDADDDEVPDDIGSPVSDNELVCVCRQPRGDRFMIQCATCLGWYHGDCVLMSKKNKYRTENFQCQACAVKSQIVVTHKEPEEIVVIDDDMEDNIEPHSVDNGNRAENIQTLFIDDDLKEDSKVPISVEKDDLQEEIKVALSVEDDKEDCKVPLCEENNDKEDCKVSLSEKKEDNKEPLFAEKDDKEDGKLSLSEKKDDKEDNEEQLFVEMDDKEDGKVPLSEEKDDKEDSNVLLSKVKDDKEDSKVSFSEKEDNKVPLSEKDDEEDNKEPFFVWKDDKEDGKVPLSEEKDDKEDSNVLLSKVKDDKEDSKVSFSEKEDNEVLLSEEKDDKEDNKEPLFAEKDDKEDSTVLLSKLNDENEDSEVSLSEEKDDKEDNKDVLIEEKDDMEDSKVPLSKENDGKGANKDAVFVNKTDKEYKEVLVSIKNDKKKDNKDPHYENDNIIDRLSVDNDHMEVIKETRSAFNINWKDTTEPLSIDSDDDDDCLIVKAEEPIKFNSNIFQLIETGQEFESDKTEIDISTVKWISFSDRTSGCLNQGCAILVDPKVSLYCSHNCVEKYTNMVIKNNLREKANEYGFLKGLKLSQMTRFVLAQPATDTVQDEISAPTPENLKDFLLTNPTYKVYQNTKPIPAKQDNEKSQKIIEFLQNDPAKHIKIVKHFATLFKKSISLKTFNAEFRNIWHHCLKIEEELFIKFDKSINEKYISRVKELSEYFKAEMNQKLCFSIINDKLSVSDFISMDRVGLDERLQSIDKDEIQASLSVNKANATKKKSVVNKAGISLLLSDTTHLHGQHLYDIKCKVCNGCSKTDEENKEKESVPTVPNDISLGINQIPSPSISSSVDTPNLAIDVQAVNKDVMESVVNNSLVVENKDHPMSVDLTNVNSTDNVSKSQKRKLLSLWEGKLRYKEVGSVACKMYLVTRFWWEKHRTKEHESGTYNRDSEDEEQMDIGSSIGTEIQITGRSQLSVVEEYLSNLRRRSKQEFIILRLHPSNMDKDCELYLSMFQYFHSRERCGVISQKKIGVKECFLYPLNAHAKVPNIFLPFIGPGLEKRRPHLLLLLLVRNPLMKMHYQPISPRYDQDDDLANAHGVNLDKYCHPNSNAPFRPSYIVTADDIVTSVVNLRTSITNDRSSCEPDNSPDYNQNNGPNTPVSMTLPSPINQENIKCTQNVLSEHQHSQQTVSIVPHCQEDSISTAACILQKVADIVQNASKCESVQISLLQKVADIVLKAPNLKLCNDSVSQTTPVKVSPNIKLRDNSMPEKFTEKLSHDAGLFHKMSDIILKESDQCCEKALPINSELSTNEISGACVTCLSFEIPPLSDPTLRPRPFVYKSQRQPIKSPPMNCDFDPLFEVEPSWDNSEERDEDDSWIDYDLRFHPVEKKRREEITEPVHRVGPDKIFLKRTGSSRVYTYYDSFEGEYQRQEKREKYFFNPYLQWSESEEFIVSDCDGSAKRRKISILSPRHQTSYRT